MGGLCGCAGTSALLRSVSRAPKGKPLHRPGDAELRSANFASLFGIGHATPSAKYGQEWIRTTEGVSQQIYSLPRLATSVPTRNSFQFGF